MTLLTSQESEYKKNCYTKKYFFYLPSHHDREDEDERNNMLFGCPFSPVRTSTDDGEKCKLFLLFSTRAVKVILIFVASVVIIKIMD